MLIGGVGIANASLLTNGTFDTNLSGWTINAPDTGVTWDAGTAHVGRTGTPGTAIFSQSFDIAAGTSQLQIDFDYEWQVTQPNSIDTFIAELIYADSGGTVTELLLSQGSDAGNFGNTVSFSGTVSLIDLAAPPSNGEIRFTLIETNNDVGTRIQLDNVFVSAVPIPAAAWLFGSGLLGLVGIARRKKAA